MLDKMVRVPAEEYAKLATMAARDGRAISKQVAYMIREWDGLNAQARSGGAISAPDDTAKPDAATRRLMEAEFKRYQKIICDLYGVEIGRGMEPIEIALPKLKLDFKKYLTTHTQQSLERAERELALGDKVVADRRQEAREKRLERWRQEDAPEAREELARELAEYRIGLRRDLNRGVEPTDEEKAEIWESARQTVNRDRSKQRREEVEREKLSFEADDELRAVEVQRVRHYRQLLDEYKHILEYEWDGE